MIFGRREFADRVDAGRRLAEALAKHGFVEPLVLALPRGGVPVGFEVAKALGAELDVLMVRKIGAPGHAEYGIGAVVDNSASFLDFTANVQFLADLPTDGSGNFIALNTVPGGLTSSSFAGGFYSVVP